MRQRLNIRKYFFLLFLPFLINLGAGGCGNDNASGNPPPEGPTGTLSAQVTDSSAPGAMDLETDSAPDVEAVFVTVARIEGHASANADNDEGGWIVISTPNKTINLSDLANAQLELSLSEVPVGTYQQMRFILADEPDLASHPFAHYFVDTNGVVHQLTVASGYKTGIRFIGGFTIQENTLTKLVIDFDAKRSIVIAGASGNFLLKPIIRIVAEEHLVTTVSGQVTNADTQQAIVGATISVQRPNDPTVVTTTTTDSNGNYSVVLAAGTYRLVASAKDFESLAADVSIASGETKTVNFALLPSATSGTLHITLNIPDIDIDIFASISIRTTVNIDGGGQALVEVSDISLSDGGSVDIVLPDGDFSVVASVNGLSSLTFHATVTADQTTNLDINF